jgi:hypothetical protein
MVHQGQGLALRLEAGDELLRVQSGFAGLQPREPASPKGYDVTTLGLEQLSIGNDRGQLPDAVFLVSSMPSETARLQVRRHSYRLIPLAFGEALSMDALSGARHSLATVNEPRLKSHAFTPRRFQPLSTKLNRRYPRPRYPHSELVCCW